MIESETGLAREILYRPFLEAIGSHYRMLKQLGKPGTAWRR